MIDDGVRNADQNQGTRVSDPAIHTIHELSPMGSGLAEFVRHERMCPTFMEKPIGHHRLLNVFALSGRR